MATDLSVTLANEPGSLARAGEVLGEAGINIEGVAGFAVDASGTVHVLVEDAAAAREALSGAGIECGDEREVEVIAVVDMPGEMGRHLRRIADAGANIDLAYLATNTRLVLGSTDPEALRRALHGG